MADASSVSSRSTGEADIIPHTHERMVKEITRFIITSGLEIRLGERIYFVEFVKRSLYPDYTEVKRIEVINEAKKQYPNLKNELRLHFASLSCKISLACDVWCNRAEENYIRITSHWIDSDWSKQRRIINFKTLNLPISGAEISSRVKRSIDFWGIKDNIVSLTVDDIIDDDEAMKDLKNFIHPILDGKLFRVRCVSRVLRSCILAGLDNVNVHIEKICSNVAFPYHHREKFISLCQKYGLEPKFGFPFKYRTSWEDTRELLKRWLKYKDVLNEYVSTRWPDSKSHEINEHDWEVVPVYIRFLDVFYEAVDFVSRNYYPSSSGVLIHLVNIAKLFSEYRGTLMFEEKISVMEENFMKHYDRIPDLFCLAAVMDPRIKLSGCECLIESYYQFSNNMEVNVDQEKTELCNLLYEMFGEYAIKFSKSKQPSSSETSASTSGFARSLISEKKQKITDLGVNELKFYLQTPLVFEKETGDFDILGWWKTHELVYPVLADMARDILTIPVSTLAPECAFVRNGERKITDESYSLCWGFLEIYTCLRDWFNAEMRTQGERDPVSYDDDDDDDDDDEDE